MDSCLETPKTISVSRSRAVEEVVVEMKRWAYFSARGGSQVAWQKQQDLCGLSVNKDESSSHHELCSPTGSVGTNQEQDFIRTS